MPPLRRVEGRPPVTAGRWAELALRLVAVAVAGCQLRLADRSGASSLGDAAAADVASERSRHGGEGGELRHVHLWNAEAVRLRSLPHARHACNRL